MRKYSTLAKNGEGLSFIVFFYNENWGDIENVAQKAVDAAVAADPLHQANGPFSATSINVAA